MLCDFCNNTITSKRRWKHCSIICTKRAWQSRSKRNKLSRFSKNIEKEYWQTATGKAFYWEDWASKKLGAKHLNLEVMSQKYDLELDGEFIDVKVGELYKRKMKRGKLLSQTCVKGTWSFKRQAGQSPDWFLCICLVDGKFHKMFKIPGDVYPPHGACIGHKSKYERFLLAS